MSKSSVGLKRGILITSIAVGLASTPQVSLAGFNWFQDLFSNNSEETAGTNTGNAALISQQDSVISDELKASAEDCVENGIGKAIETAVKVHTEIASATPSVEDLFDINDTCFSSVNKIFDLSFAIPSLASILAAAQEAVVAYAKQKICTAVNDVTGMVTSPINEAIFVINNMDGITDINGMTNKAVSGVLTGIDPKLGDKYHSTSPASTTIPAGTDVFMNEQTTFGTNSGTSSNNTLNTNTNLINDLTNQIAAQQIQVNANQIALNNAKKYATYCGAALCASSAQNIAVAEAQLAQSQAALSQLQTQVNQVVPNSTQTQTPTYAPQSNTTTPQEKPKSDSGVGSWFSDILS